MKAYSASIQLQRFVRRAIAGVLVALVATSVVGWSSRALAQGTVAQGAVAQGAEGATEKEKELLAILRGDAPAAEKALACKRLAVYGSSAAVGDLAKLLSDERLASWARIPLEAIPGAAAEEALRKSLDGLSGNLLVGVINSIGVRRDAGSVAALTARLTDKDPEVASAAAVALGHIGDGAATKALRAALPEAPNKVRSAIAEGCILSAEKALAAGRDAEAIEIYDEIRKADLPKPRIVEATRGAILARKDKGVDLLVEQLRSPDRGLFQIGLFTARELPSKKVDEALAAELNNATADRAALIIVAMADRKDTIVLPAVVEAAEKGAKPLRVSALAALGKVGDVSCLTVLLAGASDDDADVAAAAKGALAEIADARVNAELAARLAKAEGKQLPLLIELVGERRIDAVPALLKAIESSDATVRSAAIAALGNTITEKQLGVLITQAVKPKRAEDGAVALQALKTASVRMADREAVAGELAKAMNGASTATKVALLPIVAAVGGTKSLQTVGAAAKSDDDELQDASTRLLGEWPTIDAAPVLLDLAKTAPGQKYQVRAMRGYLRIARQFVMPEADRIEMCNNVLAAKHGVAEERLILDVVKRYPSSAGLKLAVQVGQNAELKDDAAQAVVAIAQKLGSKGTEVTDALNKVGLAKVKLEIVKAEYGSGSKQKDVTAVIKKNAADLQLLTLPGATYNETFGGDPAPNTQKMLRIQYRINGKAGEASFAENALIVLPMPK